MTTTAPPSDDTYLGLPPVSHPDIRRMVDRLHVGDSMLAAVRYVRTRLHNKGRAVARQMPKSHRRYAIAATIAAHAENRVIYRQVMHRSTEEFRARYFFDKSTTSVVIAEPHRDLHHRTAWIPDTPKPHTMARSSPISIFQAAEANWPEDEALTTIGSHEDRIEAWPDDTPAEHHASLMKDIRHMLGVFGRHDDATQLSARYLAAVRAGIPGIEIDPDTTAAA